MKNDNEKNTKRNKLKILKNFNFYLSFLFFHF